MEYNIYCDESCHLPNDKSESMVIGGIWIPIEKRKEICERIKNIKLENGIKNGYEIKWSKVSKLKRRVYIDLINYFFDDDDLHFRAIIIHNKSKLKFEDIYNGYDDWYYKMYFYMLANIFKKDEEYNVYIDIKDTISSDKIRKLHDVCANNIFDFSHKTIKKIQPIRSDEVEIMQIVDVLIGALSYYKRGLSSSATKLEIIDLIKKRSLSNLDKNSLYRDEKFNILQWSPR